MKQTTTLRNAARQLVSDSTIEAATKNHQQNYEKLHVGRDGTVSWFESINKLDDLIDREAGGFQAIPSVITVGTGSYMCNCDYCEEVYNADEEAYAKEQGDEYDKDEKYETVTDAIADAVGNEDQTETEESMLKSFDDIPVGYFSDEEAA